MNVGERFVRQMDIFNPDEHKIPVTIIGAGATGSYLALALAKMGMRNIIIFDGDNVEEHNFPNQLFPLSSIGKNKAKETARIVEEYTGTKIKALPYMYRENYLSGIIVSAVDKMSVRKLILDKIKFQEEIDIVSNKAKFLIDPRSGSETALIYSIYTSDKEGMKKYEKTLHPDEEAEQVPCTSRAIIYSVLILSGMIASIIRKYLTGKEIPSELIIDIINNRIIDTSVLEESRK